MWDQLRYHQSTFIELAGAKLSALTNQIHE